MICNFKIGSGIFWKGLFAATDHVQRYFSCSGLALGQDLKALKPVLKILILEQTG